MVEDAYRTAGGEVRHEPPKVKGSRFIASVGLAGTMEAAEAFREGIRHEFPDATHNCFAYRIAARVFRSGDDGEPSGSAGRPILQQIESRDLVRTVVVVTRYFGGTKLGVGGLVRAYGGAASEALEMAGVREVPITRRVRVRHPYERSGEVQSVLAALGLAPAASEFGEDVILVFDVPLRTVDPLSRELAERTAGQVRAEVLD